MKFVIKDDCYNLESIDIASPIIQPFIENILSKLSITSLDYFVVADSKAESFSQTVCEYAAIINTDTAVTQDKIYYVTGITLSGLDEDGNLHQAIVIKSMCWYAAAMDLLRTKGVLLSENDMDDNLKNISLFLILHEIGHAIDYENQYKMFCTVNTKSCYDLRYEYDEYVKQAALSLWGEYYAESTTFTLISSESDLTTFKEEELIKCIKTYSLGPNSNEITNRVYRILYFFVQRIAYIHQSSKFHKLFEYSKYTNDERISEYIPLLIRIEVAIVNLLQKYPKWDTCTDLDELIRVFKDFVDFEYLRYE